MAPSSFELEFLQKEMQEVLRRLLHIQTKELPTLFPHCQVLVERMGNYWVDMDVGTLAALQMHTCSRDCFLASLREKAIAAAWEILSVAVKVMGSVVAKVNLSVLAMESLDAPSTPLLSF